ncbi:MAG: ABC transporter permease [Rhodothermales bacterium]
MFRHNLLIAYRGFLRNKSSFLINMIGLSTGLACTLLIYLWVADEVGKDKFHENDSRLYQVMTNFRTPQGVVTWDRSPVLMGDALMATYPEVEHAAFTNNAFFAAGNISHEGSAFEATRMLASEQFFDVFSYELLQGSKEHVFAEQRNIIISDALALKLFNSTDDVVGKTVEWENLFNENVNGLYRISGVFSAPPANSTEQFDAIMHYNLMLDLDPASREWHSTAGITNIVLKKGTDVDLFNQKIANFLELQDASWEPSTQFVQQYSSRYLYGPYENGVQSGGRITYVKYFSLLAIIILLIACINFMNLSTAQASQKMREIGVKKSMGASRNNLVLQFLSESMFTVMLSLIIALGLVHLLLPAFNTITGKPIELILNARIVSSIVLIGICTGFVAGSYPAFYLSGFNPVAVLKGKRNASPSEYRVRKGLVIFQFALSVIFILGVMVVDQQLQYTQTKNMGYSRDNVISFQRPRFEIDPDPLLSELTDLVGVQHASTMARSILSGFDNQSSYSWSGDESEREILFKSPQIGYDAIETLGMNILQGRSFSRAHGDDHTKIVINESALQLMQLNEPVGTLLRYGDNQFREIIGVVSDFHYGSLHQVVEPLIFRYPDWGWGQTVMVKLNAGSEAATIEQVEQVFAQFHPETLFEFTFLDEDNLRLYEAESRVSILSKYFAFFAIIISCMGLLGLVAFTAERRTKEIGIRKILGASVWGIVKLLSTDFTKMVFAGIVVALPVSYVIAQSWLDGFAYKIDLSLWFFVGAAMITLAIAWITVGIQTLKAASINPAECLQHE